MRNNRGPFFGAVFFWKTIICQDRLRTTLRKAEQKRAFLCRIVTPDNSSYLGLGKNLLFTEFTSADDWHYEAPNFHSFFDLDADPFQVRPRLGPPFLAPAAPAASAAADSILVASVLLP